MYKTNVIKYKQWIQTDFMNYVLKWKIDSRSVCVGVVLYPPTPDLEQEWPYAALKKE